ncbi:MAG: terminase [Prevotella sp.]|nr:terminase [Prevotella sp.]
MPVRREDIIQQIIEDSDKRNAQRHETFDPVTGEGSIGKRTKVVIKDMPLFPTMFLPDEMLQQPFVKALVKAKTLRNFMRLKHIPYTEENIDTVVEGFIRVRIRYDFPFWCALYVVIQDKQTGRLIKFRLNGPQRKLISLFEEMRLSGTPIRVVLLKARQWGGSTATQIYMAWMQLVLTLGHNSAIVAHQKKASYGVRNMFKRLAEHYPLSLAYDMGEDYIKDQPLLSGTPSPNVVEVKPRQCEIEIGSAENPDSERSANTYLVHLTEVAFWKATTNKAPGDIVRSVCSGVLSRPLTLIVYESTANGTGNFFQEEYDAAKNKQSSYRSLFVAWFEIDMYSTPFKNRQEKLSFAEWLYKNRNQKNTADNRHEPGKYLYWLLQQGASLEAVHWYVNKRTEFHSHAGMAAEFPSDDIEAFVNSGKRIFDIYLVEKFKSSCKPPQYKGDIIGNSASGKEALENITFHDIENGDFWIWDMPEVFSGEKVMNRYLVVVDIGGRSHDSDYSVIAVFDRYDMIEDGLPALVAQWYGHMDHDLLAWKAAQISKFYDNALLVIESNTLETKDKNRYVNGDQSSFILEEIKGAYDNLYARSVAPSDNVKEAPEVRYGFHTNTKTKGDIISNLITVIREGLYVERDMRCIDEYLTYEEHDGSFDAIEGKHDDLLMTRAIGMWICYRKMPRPVFVKTNETKYVTSVNI